ncbi:MULTISPECIES: UDP-N-acetylglucosamine 1-carboxyvinyltransferase [Thermodesulfobacterium]|jgi:UDP-N-acetylglucosamine 1-carboxyvinyltransferase|uniref:UDP-N-acetylglucosamine 1-carboxyvinyltransferase n=2 Tax=Thermodesulfobacterium commune TaxID=1741 RepID=A0A075X097_9BACT|nr:MULTISPECIES: UDP-N-acetylglucosamine 1-carboxyvinyltransferase [Thermodesulfobacterium]KUJ98104.1 MAG: UDP-N-acetylglucosamine 1-carboxyvinyltransferase [Thermodesulfobacterium sp. 37_54]KUK19417.1 MAG: UDP-N-acetylglucosamine 1-carboxyvinyltransferase [Thermodesulfobacterium commune]AIH04417.1 UDP-N-acetylglucosamine 1-carboxyvinyltransferase [Thermodesulfobacterium commune DSM 2178]KUK38470.1 MAG: UDP-N-acetylglucosamine 1-carboxyvinyltransferase [Thermodesulfobacterium commune]MBZ468163
MERVSERRYVIKGGYPLKGVVEVSGAKNAALPAIAATLLAPGEYRLKRVPKVRDVFCMLKILEFLGATWSFEKDALIINTSGINKTSVPYELATQIRASVLFLGALLGAKGEAEVPLPGGCAIGKRPIDLHLKGMEKLGAEISLYHGNLRVKALNLKGCEIVLDFPSVTATENLLMAASVAEGETVIKNAAKEPEVVFLAEVLKSMGAHIKGEGEDTIYVKGKKKLKPAHIEIIPDRIEAGTFLVLGGLLEENELEIKNVNLSYLEVPVSKLREIGVYVEKTGKRSCLVKREKSLKATKIVTAPYPGFPTDLQPIFTVLLTQAQGMSLVVENLFENRFLYVFELNRMGANIKLEDRTAIVNGVTPLFGSPVKATDLRAGAALVLAGLCAENTTTVYNVELIERGYENFVEKLQGLGAKIEVETL